MVKIFIASFNRASDGAISKLVKKMKDEGFWSNDYKEADYILAVGDREETFDFVLKRYRENRKIIHLWAGEISQGTHDEVYRHAMTLMSCMQLCTNPTARDRVKALCRAVGKIYLTSVVGNVMLDNMDEIDESTNPDGEYDLVLYNPTTTSDLNGILKDLREIEQIVNKDNCVWIESNGDIYSEYIKPYSIGEELPITKTLPRAQFLGLLKDCSRFITNSSCQYYEAPFFIKPEQIISIGERNKERESRYADMIIKGASDKIINIFKELR